MQNIRLGAREIASIKEVATEILSKESELFLYGSRVNIDRAGGDIDLLAITKDAIILENSLNLELSFITSLTEKIGEQKVDFKIVSKKDFDSDSNKFIVTIKEQLILIWKG